MDKTSLETLEFPRIRDQIRQHCFTAEGAVLLDEQPILVEVEPVERLRAGVEPLLALLETRTDWPSLDCPPVREALAKAGPDGSVLDGLDLKSLGRYLASAQTLREFLAAREELPLKAWTVRLPVLPELAGRLNRTLDGEGQVIEESVPALKALKRDLSRIHGEIDGLSRSYLKNQDNSGLWQTDVATQKDERVLLPLKANFKGRIPSVVHESSASGNTLYIEPFDLLEKNNRLIEVQNAFRIEVLKVLRDLTAEVRRHSEDLFTLIANLAEFDTLLARARWGEARNGVFPKVARHGRSWKLHGARHPLLGAKAVPITLEMAEGTRALLLSGPNTGGKTASLKTVALLSALNQFGVPIPALGDSELPVWDDILTDIGDHQSLDAALSTFSSHMQRIKHMLGAATGRSLVLLDELGSGTDPLEGGALGMVFLQHFAQVGCCLLVTTHHGALKNFAYGQPGMKNAAVEFDAKNGLPTYRILADVPGSSHALDIALAVGMPLDLVEKARAIVDGGEGDVAKIIRGLKDKLLELHQREQELADREKAFAEDRRKTDLLNLRLKQKEHELRTFGLGDLNRYLADSRKNFEKLVKELREGGASTEKIKEAREFFAQAEQSVADQRQILEQTEAEIQPQEPVADIPLAPGTEVYIDAQGSRGTIVRDLGKGRFQVQVGSLSMTLDRKKLRAVVQTTKPQKKFEVFTSEVAMDNTPVYTLDLRGKRLEEALQEVEKQIDRALLKGLSEFSIIHGLGEGVLMKGIQDYLRSRREVTKFNFGHPQEGGFGKTIVQL